MISSASPERTGWRVLVGRGELIDRAWEQVAPLSPSNGRRGQQCAEHRRVINGIHWEVRTGVPWRDLPERYGLWKTRYERLVRWRRAGTRDRLLAHAQTKCDAVGEVVWEVGIGSTTIRAHQDDAGVRKRPARADRKRGARSAR